MLIDPIEAIFQRYKRGLAELDAGRARSQQTELGPSDLSSACDRQIGLKIQNPGHGKDPTQVNYAAMWGTAWHRTLEEVVAHDPQYMTEKFAPFGDVPEHVDVYQHAYRIVVDHKSAGDATMKRVRAAGKPDEEHLDQTHWYVLGVRAAGFEVERVGLIYWPKGNDVDKALRWSGPVDEDRLISIQARRDRIKATPDPMTLGISTKYCTWCPFFGNLCNGELDS